ncbi:TAXI family TRAP transporter solute-binding subunit [Puniceibacterium sp. IMCC21224]|uniref:TAXI family TRAP transporter solute-binding subunit n=1 Tax=Puniceibacterium sp. IMCC21224 TaxID=1618204 RepID=UPI00065D6278|nr:TAXI family TRAP transporter solute-binding subunit [Puniceibacterium sp. IMCC21224]KMK64849.1 TRAP transporter solute receptor, TAXI family [Puniceibacterium sp. IMCC21224]
MIDQTRRKLILHSTATALVGFTAFPAIAQDTLGSPDWNYEIVLGGGSATGNSRVLAGALGKIITENVQGVRASGAVSPGFDAESAIHTHEGAWHGGVGTPLTIQNAVKGVAPFPSEGIGLNLWFYHNEVPLNVLARTDTGFTSIADLKGATVALAPKGTSNYQLSEIVFADNGVSIDDITVRYMDTSEAISQLQNGNIDAMSYVRDFSGAVLELTTSREVTLLQPTEEASAKIAEQLPWSGPVDWPFVKEYPGMNVPAPGQVFVSPEFMFLDSDLPNDLVYAMTRAVWENIETVNRSSKVFENVNLQEALKRVPIPPHPGALKYYKEMDVPGWEEYQDLLPSE